MFEIVKMVIDDWDPYGLLASNAPKDEFDIESDRIIHRLASYSVPQHIAVEDIASIISDIFSYAFFPEGFTYKKCLDVAQVLFKELKNSQTK